MVSTSPCWRAQRIVDEGAGDNAWTATAGNDSYVSKVASDATLGAELDAILAVLTAG
jgi:hypothetical protein